MRDKEYIENDAGAVLLIVLVLVFLGILFDGCASREPSSTDNHHRVPQVDCNMIKFEGHFQEICCENNYCVLTQ